MKKTKIIKNTETTFGKLLKKEVNNDYTIDLFYSCRFMFITWLPKLYS